MGNARSLIDSVDEQDTVLTLFAYNNLNVPTGDEGQLCSVMKRLISFGLIALLIPISIWGKSVLVYEDDSQKIYMDTNSCRILRGTNGEKTYEVCYIMLFSVIQENGAKRLDVIREYNQHWTKSRMKGFFYLNANNKLIEWNANCNGKWNYIISNSVEEALRDKAKKFFE